MLRDQRDRANPRRERGFLMGADVGGELAASLHERMHAERLNDVVAVCIPANQTPTDELDVNNDGRINLDDYDLLLAAITKQDSENWNVWLHTFPHRVNVAFSGLNDFRPPTLKCGRLDHSAARI